MPQVKQVENGFDIVGGDGGRLRSLSEVVALVDVKRGLALWTGARETVEIHFESLRNRCKQVGISDQFETDIRLLTLPGDVSVDEMNWMMCKYLLPRRVTMRLR